MISPAFVSTVASDASAELEKRRRQLDFQYMLSTAVGSGMAALGTELRRLFVECSESNWDGEEGLPISSSTMVMALSFVRALPLSMTMPGVACAPDGSIVFDWMPVSGRMLTVSVKDNDGLAYAWLNGAEQGYAVTRFRNSEIPLSLMQRLESIVEGSNARFRAA